jgi:osmotically-inducible protein OsmY
MSDGDDFSHPNEEIVDRPSLEEIRKAVEILVLLEQEFGEGFGRIRVRVREGRVHLQGSVVSHEVKDAIEARVAKIPTVTEVDSYLGVERAD